MIMDTIDHEEGFTCDDPVLTLNHRPASFAYPQYQPHPVFAGKCFLRLTSDQPAVQPRAVSAFEPIEFHAANPARAFAVTFDYRAYGNRGQDGDGMTFVIQRDARGVEALGDGGGNLGVYGDNVIIHPALVIELDGCKCR